ncbi:MAG: hypothetical protein AAB351_02705 [Patescibacteria group bacterium]
MTMIRRLLASMARITGMVVVLPLFLVSTGMWMLSFLSCLIVVLLTIKAAIWDGEPPNETDGLSFVTIAIGLLGLVCFLLARATGPWVIKSIKKALWSKKDDWRQILVSVAVAAPIFAIGFQEVLQGQVEVGYFHMLLAIIPGAPFLRFWFLAWREGARRTMEWHRL